MLLTPAIAATESEAPKLDYVALGDSLAAGMLFDRSIGDGYADYLAGQLNELGVLGNFNKKFALPGHTAAGVLDDITKNIEKDGIAIQTALAEAEVVTISAGVNDIISRDAGLIDLETFSFDRDAVEAGIAKVGVDLATVITQIKSINPQVNVYVMGYYNAFPYAPNEVQGSIQMLLAGLNLAIEQASKVGATFVPTASAMAINAKENIPNPHDIHPGKDGYLVLANSFWKSMNLSKEVEFTDAIPAWAKEEINLLVKKGLIQGYKNGSFGANNEITRLHAAYVLKRGVVFDFDKAADPNYNDLKEGSEGYEIVAKLSEQGIFSGDNKNNFKPNDPLTRGQMAKIIVEAFGLKGGASAGLSDIDKHWAEKYIQTLIMHGVVKGYPDGTFKPDENITRAEFAKVIAQVIHLK